MLEINCRQEACFRAIPPTPPRLNQPCEGGGYLTRLQAVSLQAEASADRLTQCISAVVSILTCRPGDDAFKADTSSTCTPQHAHTSATDTGPFPGLVGEQHRLAGPIADAPGSGSRRGKTCREDVTSAPTRPSSQNMDSLWVVSADKERYQCLLPTKPLTREVIRCCCALFPDFCTRPVAPPIAGDERGHSVHGAVAAGPAEAALHAALLLLSRKPAAAFDARASIDYDAFSRSWSSTGRTSCATARASASTMRRASPTRYATRERVYTYVAAVHRTSYTPQVAVQEYYLGKYDTKKMERDGMAPLTHGVGGSQHQPPRRIRLEGGVDLPYFAVNMTGGTACELGGGAQRNTRVLYVCNQEARNEVLSIDELSTCEYQAVVLTPYLCAHPDYRLDGFPENRIQCVAQGGAPTRPKGLDVEEEEVKFPVPEPPVDKASQLVQDFLAGSHCLTGGAGWWKYEFCYGNRVSQFHEEKGRERTTILLGTWDRQRHIKWLQDRPERKPKKGTRPKYLSHFYASGDPCDVTGKPRSVEVRLKCRQVKGHPDSVSLYLLEPQTCEYILGVESAIVCSLLDTADEHGLPPSTS
ncbi:hypothetical protein HPB48_012560 [Haemaphysalis longicornis]|uniref:Endoplasmic reticulum lectin 1 n=1 Tax=Haemaphysalis longicornis TaxID=44386 RepID=A0A9J6GMW9_HAELO|nr:hypothetical protein HPB48_012560 [Haemaphysalis longicornis]